MDRMQVNGVNAVGSTDSMQVNGVNVYRPHAAVSQVKSQPVEVESGSGRSCESKQLVTEPKQQVRSKHDYQEVRARHDCQDVRARQHAWGSLSPGLEGYPLWAVTGRHAHALSYPAHHIFGGREAPFQQRGIQRAAGAHTIAHLVYSQIRTRECRRSPNRKVPTCLSVSAPGLHPADPEPRRSLSGSPVHDNSGVCIQTIADTMDMKQTSDDTTSIKQNISTSQGFQASRSPRSLFLAAKHARTEREKIRRGRERLEKGWAGRGEREVDTEKWVAQWTSRREAEGLQGYGGTQFTCFTSKKVQILTQRLPLQRMAASLGCAIPVESLPVFPFLSARDPAEVSERSCRSEEIVTGPATDGLDLSPCLQCA